VQDQRQTVLETVGRLSQQLSPHHPAPGWSSDLEVDLGIGSLERLELVTRLEQALARPVDEQKVFRARLVSDLLELDPVSSAGNRNRLNQRTLPPSPRHSKTLVEALIAQAELQPHEKALVLLEGEREAAAPTYSEMLADSRRVAAGLLEQGVKAGDRVAIMLPTSLDFFLAFYAILWVGAVAVPLYPPMRMDQMEDFLARQQAIFDNCQARLLITLPQLSPVAELLRRKAGLQSITSVAALLQSHGAPSPEAGELAFIQYTSGSTGSPKGVALTHDNLLTNIWAIGKGYGMRSGDVMVSWLPLYHDMGLIGTSLGSFSHGLPLVLMGPERFLARPIHWLRAFSNYRGSLTAAPNFAYAICAHKIPDSELTGLDLSSWRTALNGAEPILPETVEAFERRFSPYGLPPTSMFPAYGLAEATLAVTFNQGNRGVRYRPIDRQTLALDQPVQTGTDRVVSCGVPLDDVEVRIVSSQGQAQGPLVQGHVQVRGRSVMAGYFGHPPRTDPWLDTGDLGFLADGELYLTGRQKDLIIVGGRNLHPNDIEGRLGELPGIRTGCVAAFGVDEQGTQKLVVLAESRQARDSLRRAAVERIQQDTGMLAEVVLLPPRTLPKTPSGKIRRHESRKRYLEGQLRPPRYSVAWMTEALWAWGGRLASWETGRTLRVSLAFLICWLEILALKRPPQGAVRRLLRSLGISWESRQFAEVSRLQGRLCLVCNHASLLDPWLLIAAWEGPPLRFVVSDAIARHPLLRGLSQGHLRIRRGQGQASQALQHFRQSLEAGECLVVFPEGGIEAGAGVRGFATGAFRACAESGARVLPVAISGSRQLLQQGQLLPRPGKVTLHFAQPLDPPGPSFEETARATQQSRQLIAAMLGEVLVESRLARQD